MRRSVTRSASNLLRSCRWTCPVQQASKHRRYGITRRVGFAGAEGKQAQAPLGHLWLQPQRQHPPHASKRTFDRCNCAGSGAVPPELLDFHLCWITAVGTFANDLQRHTATQSCKMSSHSRAGRRSRRSRPSQCLALPTTPRHGTTRKRTHARAHTQSHTLHVPVVLCLGTSG